MKANELQIEVKNNGRSLYNSLSINDEVINRYWVKSGKYESFSKFRDLEGFDNLQALEELTDKNKDQSLCAIGTNQIFKATKSDLNKDFETIIIDFEDKAEAELYKDYLEKNLKTNSVMKPSFEVKDNQLEYTYSRVCLDEANKKLYRTQQARLSLNKFSDNQKMSSVNENCLLVIQEIHKKDKERLFTYKARQGVIGFVSSNDSLGLNDPVIEKLKESELNLVNDVKQEVKKDKLESRGSNPVNSNVKEDKKDKTEEKIEKQITKELEETTDGKEYSQLDKSELVAIRLIQDKYKAARENREAIISSYDNYIKDGESHNKAIDKLSKSYKNELIPEVIAEAYTKKTEDNLVLKKQLSTVTGNLNSLQTKTDELIATNEDNLNTMNELSVVNEDLSDKLDISLTENKALQENNDSLIQETKEKSNKIFDLTEENKALTVDHDKLSLDYAELKSESDNKDKEITELKSINSELGTKAAKTDNLETMMAAMKEQEAANKKEMEEMRAKLNKLQTENVVLNTKVQTFEKILGSNETKKEEPQDKKSFGIKEKLESRKSSDKKEDGQEDGQTTTKKHKK